MQERGCIGFVKYVMDVYSLFSCNFDKIFTSKNSYCKFLFEAQPAYVS